MSSFVISYDLLGNDGDYESLISKIKTYTGWAKITESFWHIKSSKSCVDIRTDLKAEMSNGDRLFIAELTGNAAWSNIVCNSDKLKKLINQ